MATIEQNLQKLQDSLNATYAALEQKGATIPQSHTISNLTQSINTISAGEIPNEDDDVLFIDYDGTLLYSYTAEEALALTSLPPFPYHEGLVCQEWNYTLADLKLNVQNVGECIVGAVYNTIDGKTRIHITFDDPSSSSNTFTVKLKNQQTTFSTFDSTIDWGDGSPIETITSSASTVEMSHTYDVDVDEYPLNFIVTLDISSGTWFALSQNSFGQPLMSGGSCSPLVRKIFLGYKNDVENPKTYTLNYNALSSLDQLEILTLPECNWNGNHSDCMLPLRSVKCIVFPSSFFASQSSPTTLTNSRNLRYVSLPTTLTAANRCSNTSLERHALPYTAIGGRDDMCNGCSVLQKTSIPNGATTINTSQYDTCNCLKHIKIPSTVETINSKAFSSCYALQEIELPDGLLQIGSSAFQNCQTLKRIAIPPGVTTIAENTFSACYSARLFDFRRHVAVPTLQNTNAFANTPSNKKIVVPDNLYDTWIATNNWSSSTNNIKNSIIKASAYVE